MIRSKVITYVVGILMTSILAHGQTPAVRGRVVGANKSPIAGADVHLMALPSVPIQMPNMPKMTGMPPTLQAGRSGEDGSFALPSVAAGQYVLEVSAVGYERSSMEIAVPAAQPVEITLTALDIPGVEGVTGAAQSDDRQVLLDRIAGLEKRLGDLEATAVLSEPETRPRRQTTYVGKDGTIYDQPTPGAKKITTYERQRVNRRQNIADKIDEALAADKEGGVTVGVSAAVMAQSVVQNFGQKLDFDRHKYALGNADITFSSRVAQNTLFFADIVGLSGPSPDPEVKGLTLLNSFTSRLLGQSQLNIREAWLRTELLNQKLGITAGRLDLTNYFDRNAVANDETTQFLSDALVNNQAIGLAVNGLGAVGVFDAKNKWQFKAGFQQSNLLVNNLSESLFGLGEISYTATPFSLLEGNYRVWGRSANSAQNPTLPQRQARSQAWGISADQRITPEITVFGRYGNGIVDPGRLKFYSTGFQVRNKWIVNPSDTWAFGWSKTDIPSLGKESLFEAYYNFRLTEKLRFSFHMAHTTQDLLGGQRVGYFVPGVRFQASF